jgi:hypothetical protein
MTQDDNRGALWLRAKGVADGTEKVMYCEGLLDLEGRRYRADLCRVVSVSERAPAYMLHLVEARATWGYAVALFGAAPEKKRIFEGKLTKQAGEEYWVHVYRAEKKQANSPALRLHVLAAQPKPEQPAEDGPPPDDEIPF